MQVLKVDLVTGAQEIVEAPDPAPIVPEAVTMAQARLALLDAGLLSQVDTVIAALPSPQREVAQIEWEFRATVQRDSQLMQAIGAALGLDAGQIDALFVDAEGR